MKQSHFTISLAVFLLLFSSATFAREGRYVALGLGHSETQISGINYTSEGVGVLIGAQYSENFALEIEYVDFGQLIDTGAKISANSKGIAALFLQPMTQRASVYLRVGVAQVNAAMSGTGLTGLRTAISSLPYGLGFQYEYSPSTTIRLFADAGYGYQVNGTTTTITTTNYSSNGDISRIGFTTLYTFD